MGDAREGSTNLEILWRGLPLVHNGKQFDCVGIRTIEDSIGLDHKLAHLEVSSFGCRLAHSRVVTQESQSIVDSPDQALRIDG